MFSLPYFLSFFFQNDDPKKKRIVYPWIPWDETLFIPFYNTRTGHGMQSIHAKELKWRQILLKEIAIKPNTQTKGGTHERFIINSEEDLSVQWSFVRRRATLKTLQIMRVLKKRMNAKFIWKQSVIVNSRFFFSSKAWGSWSSDWKLWENCVSLNLWLQCLPVLVSSQKDFQAEKASNSKNEDHQDVRG